MKLGAFPKNTLIYMAGGIIAAGGNVILAPIYLRVMDPEEFGVWSRFLLHFQIAQSVMGWGLMASVTRLLTDCNNGGDSNGITMDAIKIATFLNGTLIILTSCISIFCIFFMNIKLSSDAFIFLSAMICASLLVYPLILMGNYISTGDALKHRSLSLVGFCFQCATLFVACLMFRVTSTVSILAMVTAMAFYGGLALLLLSRQAIARSSLCHVRPLIAFGLPVMMYTVAGQTSEFTIRYLLSLKSTSAEFGQFSGILLYASVIAMASSAINLAWIPLLYRNAPDIYTSGIYRSFTSFLIALTSGAAVFMVLFAPEMIDFFSGGELRVSRQIILFLTISAWLSSVVWTSLSNPLFEQKKTGAILLITLGAAIFSLPVSVMLIDKMQGNGAAMALSLNSFMLCILAFFMNRRMTAGNCSAGVIAISLSAIVAASEVPTINYFVQLNALHFLIHKIFLLIILIFIPLAFSIKSGIMSMKYINELVTK
jgi:O-antigen/teichoic acid export membrane protein